MLFVFVLAFGFISYPSAATASESAATASKRASVDAARVFVSVMAVAEFFTAPLFFLCRHVYLKRFISLLEERKKKYVPPFFAIPSPLVVWSFSCK